MEISLYYYATNDSPNALRVRIGPLSLWFSYGILVAFRAPWTNGTVVCGNVWTRTTGKHINEIRSKEYQLSEDEFLKQRAELERRLELVLHHMTELDLVARLEDAERETATD